MFLHFWETEKHNRQVDDASLRNHLMMDSPILNQNQVQRKGGHLRNQDDDISHQKPCLLYRDYEEKSQHLYLPCLQLVFQNQVHYSWLNRTMGMK